MTYRTRQTGGQYELKEILGRGAFGVVQRCIDTRTGEQFAAKLIETLRMSKRDLMRIEQEAQICRMLKHRHIVQLHDSFHMSGQYVMIFDLITGGELFEEIVAREFYSEASAGNCIRFVLDAIAYCHDMRIMHRDLKPENILLASKARNAPVKIADFGLAVKVPDNQPRFYGLAGTYAYMAPEVISENSYNLSVDVWSCGVILYLLLCGYPPFWDVEDEALKRKILFTRHTYPWKEWGKISASAKNLIDQMLERNPKRRITAAGALNHSWLRDLDTSNQMVHLSEAIAQLKRFNARRKMKGAVLATMVALRQFRGMRREDGEKKSSEKDRTRKISSDSPNITIIRDLNYIDTDDNEENMNNFQRDTRVINIDESLVHGRQNNRSTLVANHNLPTSAEQNYSWIYDDVPNYYHPRANALSPKYVPTLMDSQTGHYVTTVTYVYKPVRPVHYIIEKNNYM